jgi:YjbE family integral membrane protein
VGPPAPGEVRLGQGGHGVTFDATFFSGVFSIVLIDVALAGDNAVVIAMAARTLPKEKRRKAIFLGAFAAVLVRVAFTFFVAQLLSVPFVKLVGGLVILWVAVKLFVTEGPAEGPGREARNIWEAVKIIVIADISMGVDNMLAVGGASGGSLTLLLFGLGLSIPLVVFASDYLSRLMDRFPVILYIGAAILGRVSGNMIMTDPTTAAFLEPSAAAVYAVEALLALAIVGIGWEWRRRAARRLRAQPVDMGRNAA